jgi:hypothetical protein
MEGEQLQIECSGLIALKQMRHSVYGARESPRMRRDVRSVASAGGRFLRGPRPPWPRGGFEFDGGGARWDSAPVLAPSETSGVEAAVVEVRPALKRTFRLPIVGGLPPPPPPPRPEAEAAPVFAFR